MIQKYFKKFVTTLVLILASFPVNLKAQIFGGFEEGEENKGLCLRDPDNVNCEFINCTNTPDLTVCLPDESARKGVEALGGTLKGSGIAETQTFADLVFKYVNFALPYLALAAFIGFVYAGFLYVTSYGNDEQVQKSKKIMIYAVVGLILVILSFSIVQLFTVELVKTINPAAQ